MVALAPHRSVADQLRVRPDERVHGAQRVATGGRRLRRPFFVAGRRPVAFQRRPRFPRSRRRVRVRRAVDHAPPVGHPVVGVVGHQSMIRCRPILCRGEALLMLSSSQLVQQTPHVQVLLLQSHLGSSMAAATLVGRPQDARFERGIVVLQHPAHFFDLVNGKRLDVVSCQLQVCQGGIRLQSTRHRRQMLVAQSKVVQLQAFERFRGKESFQNRGVADHGSPVGIVVVAERELDGAQLLATGGAAAAAAVGPRGQIRERLQQQMHRQRRFPDGAARHQVQPHAFQVGQQPQAAGQGVQRSLRVHRDPHVQLQAPQSRSLQARNGHVRRHEWLDGFAPQGLRPERLLRREVAEILEGLRVVEGGAELGFRQRRQGDRAHVHVAPASLPAFREGGVHARVLQQKARVGAAQRSDRLQMSEFGVVASQACGYFVQVADELVLHAVVGFKLGVAHDLAIARGQHGSRKVLAANLRDCQQKWSLQPSQRPLLSSTAGLYSPSEGKERNTVLSPHTGCEQQTKSLPAFRLRCRDRCWQPFCRSRRKMKEALRRHWWCTAPE